VRIIAKRPNFRLRLLVYFTIDQLTGLAELVTKLTARRDVNYQHTQLVSIVTRPIPHNVRESMIAEIAAGAGTHMAEEMAMRGAPGLGITEYGPSAMTTVLQKVWAYPPMAYQPYMSGVRDLPAESAERLLFGATIPELCFTSGSENCRFTYLGDGCAREV